MKKVMNLFVWLIFIVSVIIIPNFSMAIADSGTDAMGGGSTAVTPINQKGLGDLDNYRGSGADSITFSTKVSNIVGILSSIGIVTSVVGLVVIGLKYMLGSIEERADYKKTLVPYIVGCFLVFTVSIIPQLIYTFMSNF